jgi:hypothetical protein
MANILEYFIKKINKDLEKYPKHTYDRDAFYYGDCHIKLVFQDKSISKIDAISSVQALDKNSDNSCSKYGFWIFYKHGADFYKWERVKGIFLENGYSN